MALNRKKLLLLMLCLGGCLASEQSEIAIVALIANAGQYDQRSVSTYGFLKKNNGVRLFINREDAFNNNRFHSIKIDGLSDHDLASIEPCINQYVLVSGTIYSNQNGLSFEDAVQIKGKSENIYSKLVCNYNFN